MDRQNLISNPDYSTDVVGKVWFGCWWVLLLLCCRLEFHLMVVSFVEWTDYLKMVEQFTLTTRKDIELWCCQWSESRKDAVSKCLCRSLYLVQVQDAIIFWHLPNSSHSQLILHFYWDQCHHAHPFHSRSALLHSYWKIHYRLWNLL